MNELEQFIVDLNLIQKENLEISAKYQKIADYLFTGPGWKILKSIYEQSIQINVIFGDKLNNLLLDTCSKLIENFAVPDTELYLPSDSIRLPEKQGSLFYLIQICLNLYIRFNDGTNNSILTSTNSIFIQFCQILFNNFSKCDQIKLVYLKFLEKIFKINFENLSKKTPLPQNVSNKFFLENFNIIETKIQTSQENKLFYLKIIINYLYECSRLNISFENIIHLVYTTSEFVFENLFEEAEDWKK